MKFHNFIAFILLITLFSVSAYLKPTSPRKWYSLHQSIHLHSVENNLYRTDSNGKVNHFEKKFFDQRIDHFNPSDTRTFKQKYYESLEFHTPYSPYAIFYFNGEGPASDIMMTTDNMVTELAKQYNAKIIIQEQRYYGESFPVKDLKTDSLKYLSDEYHLADAANFILTKEGLIDEPHWIAIGGSYSGFLSTSARIKYPHIFKSAYSSSGVVWPVVDYHQYWESVVVDILNQGNPCRAAFYNITKQITDKLNSQEGRKTLKKIFNLCTDLGGDLASLKNFWYQVSGNAEEAAQYGKIGDMCKNMTTAKDPLQAYADTFKYMAEEWAGINYDDHCLEVDWITPLKNEDLTIPYFGEKTWLYQKCTQYGFFKSPTYTAFFSHLVDLDYHYDYCTAIFDFAKPPPCTNIGAHHVKTNYGYIMPGSNSIISVAGHEDPWHIVCQNDQYKDDEPVIFIKANDSSHCKDLHGPSPKDSAEMKKARKDVKNWIYKWMKQYNKTLEYEF